MKRAGIEDVLIAIHWWSDVDVVFSGEKAPDPSVYRSYVPARLAWNDPV